MKIKILYIAILLSVFAMPLHAQETDSADVCLRPSLSLEYIGELQSDFRNSKFVNLLHLDAEVPLSRKLSFNYGSISIATTDANSLADDLQTFSNIDSDNLPLALTVAGLTWHINDRHTLFGGVRRMDEDYFCSDGLALFINSSCGAFPTVSANYNIGLFPMAAVGIHYAYEKEFLTIQGSFYNGTGHNRFSGRDNVFRVCPNTDGVFALAQAEYYRGDSHYFIGGTMHYGESTTSDTRKLRPTMWGHIEQSVSPSTTLIGCYGHAFSSDSACKNFVGLGGIYSHNSTQFGIFTDYTRIDGTDEFATEFTCNIGCLEHLSLQPVVHLIATGSSTTCIGMLRLKVSL